MALNRSAACALALAASAAVAHAQTPPSSVPRLGESPLTHVGMHRYLASGSGRTWMCIALLVAPLPPS